MSVLRVRRVGCEKELCLLGRKVFGWVDRKKVMRDIWRHSRWMKDYISLRQHRIELPADVEQYWTGRYELPRVALSELFRYTSAGKLIPLCESPMALYCKTQDVKYLREFYSAAVDIGVTSDSEEAYIPQEQAHMDRILKENDGEGPSAFEYDISRSCIVIDEQNVVLDGHHRLSLLFAKYGPEYVVRVVRIIGGEW